MQVAIETVAPKLIAAVTARVQIKDIPDAWAPALTQVKAFLAGRPDLATSGRHVFLYHHPTERDQPMDIDFGIEVATAFDGNRDVRCIATPDGRVAVAKHTGSLLALPQTHLGIHQWCSDHGHRIGGYSWETYVWGDGPDPVEIVVSYLLL